MSSASKHGEEAIGQDMHWCKAQLSLGASEVSQEPVLPLEGFVLEYCLTLASLRVTGTSEEKGKSSHVPRPVVGLHCYLLSPLEKVCTDLLFLGTHFSGLAQRQTYKVLPTPATRKELPTHVREQHWFAKACQHTS